MFFEEIVVNDLGRKLDFVFILHGFFINIGFPTVCKC